MTECTTMKVRSKMRRSIGHLFDAGTRCSGLDPITVDRAMQKLLEMKTRQIEDFHSACELIPYDPWKSFVRQLHGGMAHNENR